MAHKTSFLKHIRAYILFFTFFGLWTSFEKFKYKIILRIYAVVSLLFVVAFFISIGAYSDKFYTFTTVSNTVANSLFALIMAVHLIIVLETFVRRGVQSQLIEKFTFVDKLFEAWFKMPIVYGIEQRDSFTISLSFLIIIIPIYFGIIAYFYYIEPSNFTCHNAYSSLLIRFRIIQVSFFVYLLRNRLHLLNDKLIHITKAVYRTKCIPKHSRRSPLILSIAEVLINLKRIYMELNGVCDLINSAFEWSLLASVVQMFFDLTSSGYWAFLIQAEPYVSQHNRTDFNFFGCVLFPLHIMHAGSKIEFHNNIMMHLRSNCLKYICVGYIIGAIYRKKAS